MAIEIKNRPEIDGLRAVAVLPVLFYHAGLSFTGGYVGVDIFFVISGYLITSLVLRDLAGDGFTLVDFWERRIRRILPALVTVVFACLVAGWFLFLPNDYKELGQSVVAQSSLMSNVYFWRHTGYFVTAVETMPLIHTWSLAVEEQFYLFFPLLLVSLKRFFPSRWSVWLVILGAVSFSWSVYGSFAIPTATFYLLPSRAWELLLGAMLAALPTQGCSNRWWNELCGWSGLGGILYAVFFYNQTTRFPGLAAAVPCGGAALIIWTNGRQITSLGRALAWSPFVFVGLISYSLYLWHWPLLAFARYLAAGELSVAARLLLLALSVVLAAASWKYVETGVRKRIVFKTRATVFAVASIASALLLFSGAAIHVMQGCSSRLAPDVRGYVTAATGSFDRDVSLISSLKGEFLPLGASGEGKAASFLLWGDSHAMAVAPVLDALGREHGEFGVQATHYSTAPLLGYECRARWATGNDSLLFNHAVVDFIREKQVRKVLLVAYWNGYMARDNGDADAKRLNVALLNTVAAVRAAGARVWIMRQVPEQSFNVPRALFASSLFIGNSHPMGVSLEEYGRQSHREDLIFEGILKDCTIFNPTPFFFNGNQDACLLEADGMTLYRDSHHLSEYGAMKLRTMFDPLFKVSGTDKKTVQIQ